MLRNGYHVMDHVDDYLHGLLAGWDAEYLEEHCQKCTICEAALAEARKRAAAFETVPVCEASEELIRNTVANVEQHAETSIQVRKWVKLGVFGSVAAAVLILGGLHLYYLNLAPSSYDLLVLGQQQLLAGTPGALRVTLTDRKTGQPVAGAPVRVELRDKNNRAVELARFKTDAQGTGQLKVQLPDWEEGTCELRVVAEPGWFSGAEELRESVALKRSWKLMLTSDKPVYQPGQQIRIRSLALRRPDLQPVASQDVQFSVTDPKGNLIFKRKDVTSKFGISSLDCPLATELIEGPYTIGCKVGDTETKLQVDVKKYVLPRFKIALSLEKPYYLPGERVRGKVQADYFYGKPVAVAPVEIAAAPAGGGKPFAELKATTDADGKAEFEFVLPTLVPGQDAPGGVAVGVQATIAVKDAAGQDTGAKETRRIGTVVATELINVTVIPEGGTLVRDLPNKVYVFATYPDGSPAAKTRVQVTGLEAELTTSALGVATFEVTPATANGNWTIKATDGQGNVGRRTVPYQCGTPGQDFVFRTDRAVYTGGDDVHLVAITGGTGPVFVDFIKDGQTMLTEAVPLINGRGSCAITLPAELFGTIELCAYHLTGTGLPVRKTRVIYIHQAKQLTIAAKTDHAEYRPGGQARLRLTLSDSAGNPVPGAISLAAVDEAVFSVLEQRPGLEKTFYGLEQKLLKPVYELYPWAPDAGKRDEARIEWENALFARTAKTIAPTTSKGSTPHTMTGTSYPAKEQKVLATRRVGLDRITTGWWIFGSLLLAAGFVHLCIVYQPWMAVHRWLEDWEEREVEQQHERARRVESHGFNIALGTLAVIGLVFVVCVMTIAVLGSNASKSFDMVAGARMAESGMPIGAKGSTMPMMPKPADPPPGTKIQPVRDDRAPQAVMDEPAAAPARTREYFPETLLWKPEVITDENGNASLDIELADSITTWRLSASAVAADGRLGAASEAIRVFQPFFVDVNLPVTLTRGDEITVPVVVSSYLNAEQTVTVELKPADWYELMDGERAVRTLELKPEEKRAVRFPIKVRKVGMQPLTVEARGIKMSDAIKRLVEVVPDGQKIERVVNGTLLTPADLTLNLPANAIDGSGKLLVKCYPSDFSQLVEGLENIFRMPSGCFEQTSSTTYPNILALDYLRRTGKSAPAVEAKARHFIQTGYQRLLSFEVNGGGFDWFGRPPANRTLTAYGLMEFVDMARVADVDPRLIDRTRLWLINQRQADGSWAPEGHDIHDGPGARTGAMARYATTAYIAWAVFDGRSADAPDSSATRNFLLGEPPERIGDSYVLALACNALLALESPVARTYIDTLRARAQVAPDGKLAWWDPPAGSRTCFYAGGRSAQVETTALATLALLRSGRHPDAARAALAWLARQKDANGTWHSTQATVLALKALVAGTGKSTADEQARDIELTVGAGKRKHAIPAEESDVVQQIDLSDLLKTGDNRLTLKELTGHGTGYQVTFRYHVPRRGRGREARTARHRPALRPHRAERERDPPRHRDRDEPHGADRADGDAGPADPARLYGDWRHDRSVEPPDRAKRDRPLSVHRPNVIGLSARPGRRQIVGIRVRVPGGPARPGDGARRPGVRILRPREAGPEPRGAVDGPGAAVSG